MKTSLLLFYSSHLSLVFQKKFFPLFNYFSGSVSPFDKRGDTMRVLSDFRQYYNDSAID